MRGGELSLVLNMSVTIRKMVKRWLKFGIWLSKKVNAHRERYIYMVDC